MIKVETPPNFDEISKYFDVKTRPVFFAYAPYVYNPGDLPVPEFIAKHELVHLQRQAEDPAGWWKKYLEDEKFRFDEEVIAHAVEFVVRAQFTKDRNARNRLLMQTAARVVAPLYKYTKFTLADAVRALKAQ